MHWSYILTSAVFLSKMRGKDFLRLVLDFALLENTGRIRICNIISCCERTENVQLIKEMSQDFRCSISVSSPEVPMSRWYSPFHLQFFALDYNCPGSERILREAEALGLFNGNFVWLILNTGERINTTRLKGTVVKNLEGLNVTINSQVHVAQTVSEDKYEILGFYKRVPTERLILEVLGYWTPAEGLVFTGVRSPAVRRRNMEGRLFIGAIVVTQDDSLNHLFDMVNPHIDNPSKVNAVFFDLVIQAMNGRLQFMVARKWGEVGSNGSFDGMIGHVVRREADLLISPLIMAPDRMQVLHYIALTEKIRIKFIFLSPPLSYKNNIYVLPFGINVWYCCIVLFFSSVVLLFLVAKYEEVMDGRSPQLHTAEISLIKPLSTSFTDIILLNVGHICQQDQLMEPKGVCGRIVILHVRIAVLFLYVSYSAAILVLLQSSDRSITTLKDLHKSNLKLGVHYSPYNRYYFKTAWDPLRKSIAARVNKDRDFMSPEEGITKVRSGLFAFHVDRTTGYLIVRKLFEESEKCRLQELDESFIPDLDPLVAVRKDDPYAEVLTIMFRRVYERGHVRREGHRKSARKPPCRENTMSYASVGLIDCEGAFIFISYGMLISVVIFMAELSVFKFKSRKANERVTFGYYE